MRNTKKILVLALCAGLSFATLTGCNKKTEKKGQTKKEVTIDPKISNAKSYLELADYSPVSLKKADIDKKLKSTINSALESKVTYQKIKKGKVKKGDTVNIYYVGKINGKAFEGGSCTKKTSPEGYDLKIGSNTFIEGFETGLIGKTVGKTYDVNTKFPKQYDANKSLAGKKAIFTVTINSKQGKKIVPKLNDAFVKKNLPQYTSAADYKKKARESIMKEMAVEKICNETKIKKYPKDRVDEMKKQLKASIESYLKNQNMTIESYLANMNTTQKQYDKQIEDTAKKDIAKQLVYNAIAQTETLEVSNKEYKEELQTYLKNYNKKSEADLNQTFKKNYGTDVKSIIYNDILYKKIGDFLLEKIEEK